MRGYTEFSVVADRSAVQGRLQSVCDRRSPDDALLHARARATLQSLRRDVDDDDRSAKREARTRGEKPGVPIGSAPNLLSPAAPSSASPMGPLFANVDSSVCCRARAPHLLRAQTGRDYSGSTARCTSRLPSLGSIHLCWCSLRRWSRCAFERKPGIDRRPSSGPSVCYARQRWRGRSRRRNTPASAHRASRAASPRQWPDVLRHTHSG